MIEKIRKVKLVKGLCVATALVAMFLVFGCDDSDKAAGPTPTPTPVLAKYVTVTGTLNPAGGSITANPENTASGSATLNAPAGALDGNVTFEIMYADGDQEPVYPEKLFSKTDQAGGGRFKSVGFMSIIAKDAQGNVVTNLGGALDVKLILPEGAAYETGVKVKAGDSLPVWVKDWNNTSVKFTPPCNGKWTFLGNVTVTAEGGSLVIVFQITKLCQKKLYFSAQWLIDGGVTPTGTGGTGGGSTT